MTVKELDTVIKSIAAENGFICKAALYKKFPRYTVDKLFPTTSDLIKYITARHPKLRTARKSTSAIDSLAETIREMVR